MLLRSAAGVGLVLQVATTLRGQLAAADIAVDVLVAGSGLLLLLGLWTPIVGVVAALCELWAAYSFHRGDPWIYLLLGALAISLALLGPGAYSIDARLFGWKRIEIPDRKS